MRVLHLDREASDLGPSAVTIGKFNGLHRGHQAIIAQLTELARQRGLASIVATFDRHPLAVIAPDKCPQPLADERRQAQLIAETGVDALAIMTFDRAFASLTPEEFIQQVIVERLEAKLVLVGEDFRFGHFGAGNVDTLREAGVRLGFDVIAADVLRSQPGEPKFSSSSVRAALSAGDVDTAAAVLGRSPSVGGFVVHGAKRGRELGFPTANLGPGEDPATHEQRGVEGFVPADGVYAGWLDVSAGGPDGADTGEVHRYPAAVSVGTNPTFDDVPRTVEAHVIDRDDDHVGDFDLYGRWARVVFVARLRGMVAFTGLEPLIEQMHRDCDETRAVLQSSVRRISAAEPERH
ncbi:bifunctional riboflavin kinase/FAD synthetase [Pseudoclavibacter sp. CFCC 14310]|uniref:bifunctional riboflavin kinase/FAD synthetase n=1 Tax=Pseudoclavibacter sp. CFCC 14310 TaxID=2615180 RepID=UPI001301767E|nr:bifunctional riboflavin kinase/FAD synthetase [Pseudoclavibacter sp. CFCC 14310]KAB1643721.1 bifunctional riboflavin kinase/FAD synthetase [Pseudoclavibacter sp. CFCC 14310]